MIKLRELVDYYIGGGWGKPEEDAKHLYTAYVIRGTDMPSFKNGDISSVPYRFHAESNLKSRVLKHKDIIIEVSGGSTDQPVGRTLLFNKNNLRGISEKFICASFCKLIRPNKTMVNQFYMYYVLQNCYNSRKICQWEVQSTGIKNFKFENFLDEFKINLPLIPNQQKIASVLSAYDKLIANNTRRIEILEEMAQRIYKEWFVDFKYPGYENDELVDSELGNIPKDWEILEYDSITNIISRGPSIKYVDKDSGIPVLNQKCVRNGEIQLDAIKYGSPLNTNKEHCYLQLNDILINSMGVGTLGRISRNLSINSKMIIHNCITFLRADQSKVNQSFLYYSLKRNQIYFEQLGIGATGQTSLKIDIIKGKEVIVPKQNLLNEFDKLVNPIWREIGFLKNKNHNLQQTRDHLLPKLISGKVDVSDLDINTDILND